MENSRAKNIIITVLVILLGICATAVIIQSITISKLGEAAIKRNEIVPQNIETQKPIETVTPQVNIATVQRNEVSKPVETPKTTVNNEIFKILDMTYATIKQECRGIKEIPHEGQNTIEIKYNNGYTVYYGFYGVSKISDSLESTAAEIYFKDLFNNYSDDVLSISKLKSMFGNAQEVKSGFIEGMKTIEINYKGYSISVDITNSELGPNSYATIKKN